MAEFAATMNRPPYRHAPERDTQRQPSVNVGDVERWFSVIGGGMLALYGLRRSLGPLALIAGGGALIYRGLTGHCAVYEALQLSTTSADKGPGITLEAAITVHKPAARSIVSGATWKIIHALLAHLKSVVSAGDNTLALGSENAHAAAH